MPSRIRIILAHTSGAVYIGKKAMFEIYGSLPLGRMAVLKKEFPTRLGRLLEAAKELDPKWTLTLIREVRGLKRSKSLYWKMKKGKIEPDPVPEIVAHRVVMLDEPPRRAQGIAAAVRRDDLAGIHAAREAARHADLAAQHAMADEEGGF